MQKRSTARLDSMGSSVPKYKYIYMLCVVYGMAWHGKSNHIHKHTRSFFARLLACLPARTHTHIYHRTEHTGRGRENQYAGTHNRQAIAHTGLCCCCCLFFFDSFQFYWVDLLCCSTHIRMDRFIESIACYHICVFGMRTKCAHG